MVYIVPLSILSNFFHRISFIIRNLLKEINVVLKTSILVCLGSFQRYVELLI